MQRPHTISLVSALCLAVAATAYAPGSRAQDRQENDNKAGEMLKGLLEETFDQAVPGDKPTQPRPVWPADGREFATYHGPFPLRWEPAENVDAYEIEIDCKACQGRGRWARNQGEVWRYDAGISGSTYRLDLSPVSPTGAWRWRVRATQGNEKSAWSRWSHFVFGSTASTEYQDPGYDSQEESYGAQGYGNQGYDEQGYTGGGEQQQQGGGGQTDQEQDAWGDSDESSGSIQIYGAQD